MSKRIAQVVLILGSLAALGWWPSGHYYGRQGIVTMLAIAAICGGAMVVSLIPLTRALANDSQGLIPAWLVGTMLRVFITLLAATLYCITLDPPMGLFIIWVMIDYWALLIWEVIHLVKITDAVSKTRSLADLPRQGRLENSATG